MNQANLALVRSLGLYCPPVAGYLIAFYLDRCAAGFSPDGPWRDSWSSVAGPVLTFGFGVGPVCLRVVIERQLIR